MLGKRVNHGAKWQRGLGKHLRLAVLFFLFSYFVLTVRANMLGGYSLHVWGAKRLLTTAAGAALLIQVAHFVDETANKAFTSRISGLAIRVGLGAGLLLATRVLYDGYSQDRSADALFEDARWMLVWIGYFAAWSCGYLAFNINAPKAGREPEMSPSRAENTIAGAVGEGSLWAHRNRQVVRMSMGTVRWIEAEGNYVRIHNEETSALVRSSLTKMEKRLDPNVFIRVHRSVICNKSAIAALRRGPTGALRATLIGGAEVPIGRAFGKAVFALAKAQPI